MFHPPGFGQREMWLIPLFKHCLPDEIKWRPGEVEQTPSTLQVHQKFTCFCILDPQDVFLPFTIDTMSSGCTTLFAGPN
eukprot:12891083-Prorocentrum_lima.AAC.1